MKVSQVANAVKGSRLPILSGAAVFEDKVVFTDLETFLVFPRDVLPECEPGAYGAKGTKLLLAGLACEPEYPLDDFPPIPEAVKGLGVLTDETMEAFGSVNAALSQDRTREVINRPVCMKGDIGGTDGKRLHMIQGVGYPEAFEEKPFGNLSKLFALWATACIGGKLYREGNVFRCVSDGVEVIWRNIEGTVPNFHQVIPVGGEPITLPHIDKAKTYLKTVGKKDEPQIHLAPDGSEMSAGDWPRVKLPPWDRKICLSIQFMLEASAFAETGRVLYQDELSPLKWEGENKVAVLMPKRMT